MFHWLLHMRRFQKYLYLNHENNKQQKEKNEKNRIDINIGNFVK